MKQFYIIKLQTGTVVNAINYINITHLNDYMEKEFGIEWRFTWYCVVGYTIP